jgi:hypothetical protein
MEELKSEIGEDEMSDDIKLQLHQMKNTLNSVWLDDVELSDDDKEILITQFTNEMTQLDIPKDDEVYVDILDILYRLGITREELGIEEDQETTDDLP